MVQPVLPTNHHCIANQLLKARCPIIPELKQTFFFVIIWKKLRTESHWKSGQLDSVHAVKSLPLAVSLILSTVAAVGDDRQSPLTNLASETTHFGTTTDLRQTTCLFLLQNFRKTYLYSAARTPWGQDAFLEAKCLWKQLLDMYS